MFCKSKANNSDVGINLPYHILHLDSMKNTVIIVVSLCFSEKIDRNDKMTLKNKTKNRKITSESGQFYLSIFSLLFT